MLGFKNHFLRTPGRLIREIAGEIVSQHHADQIRAGDVFDVLRANVFAVPHNHGTVADLKNFLQPVGEIDDRNAFFLGLSDDPEKDFRLPVGKGRRRLIQDEDFHIGRNRLGNLHQLHLRQSEGTHIHLRVDRHAELIENRLGLTYHLLIIHKNAVSGVFPHKNIFADGQIRHQVELLIYGRDAQLIDPKRIHFAVRLPQHLDGSLIRNVCTGQAFDQCRFSGSIFTNKSEDLALVERK